MEFTLQEIIEATKANIIKNDLKGNETFTFSTDTRTIKEGEIYLPLKGENFDGEKFIDKALEAGAVGYFTTHNCPPPQPSPSRGTGASALYSPLEGESKSIDFGGGQNSKLILLVKNTLTAYLQLARFYKRKINPRTIAITGSCGKTTTKEMAYCVASEKFKTHKSELNFNNEIGLCKTILSMPADTEVLILEMGMRGLGEIELLSKYSEPDIAIIANVGTAHIGRLGSRENVAKAKCEIVKYMKDGGLLIAHDEKLIKENIKLFSLSAFQLFSLNDAIILEHSVGKTKFEYKDNKYELNIEGDYNIQNALAAIETGLSLGLTPQEIHDGLIKYSPLEKRWEVKEIKGFKIINDSYNANPESMKAAIKTALDTSSTPLLLVLGDMGELGKDESEYHRQIGEFLIENLNQIRHAELDSASQGLSHFGLPRRGDAPPRNDAQKWIEIITVGKLANEISKVLNENKLKSKNFETNLQTSRYILDNVKVGTTIVLKASRSMKFEEILIHLVT